jgi:hypothetical protein
MVKLKSHMLPTHSSSLNRLTSLPLQAGGLGRRHFSTLRVNNSNKNSSRKTLNSPEANPYEDLYLGRGKPELEPV